MTYITNNVLFNTLARVETSDSLAAADAKTGTIVLKIKMEAGNSANQSIFEEQASYFWVRRSTSNVIRIQGLRSTGATTLILNGTTLLDAATGSGWHTVVASWDLANAAGHLYVDGASDSDGSPTLNDNEIDYTRAGYAVGGTHTAGGNPLKAQLGLVCFSSEYVDLSDPAVLGRFLDTNNKIKNPGRDGRNWFNSPAEVLLLGNYRQYFINNGSNANFDEGYGDINPGDVEGRKSAGLVSSQVTGASGDISFDGSNGYIDSTGVDLSRFKTLQYIEIKGTANNDGLHLIDGTTSPTSSRIVVDGSSITTEAAGINVVTITSIRRKAI